MNQNIGTIVGISGLMVRIRVVGHRPVINQLVCLKDHPEAIFLVHSYADAITVVAMNIVGSTIIKNGDEVADTGGSLQVPVGDEVLGRAFNALGQPIDGKGLLNKPPLAPIFAQKPLSRETSKPKFELLETGIKVIDFLAPFVKGHKIGIIGGAGVGKTVLTTEIMNNIVSHAEAITMFVGIGERIREGHELYVNLKAKNLLDSTIMFLGQMNENAAMRSLVGWSAARVAQYFRDDRQRDVLFFVDNIYRFVQANNELSTMLGEIPSEGGYQPSMYTQLRRFEGSLYSNDRGSVTSVQSIYIPADDLSDPALAEISSQLDSVIVLSRKVFESGVYPAVDLLNTSSSLLTPEIVGERHYMLAGRVAEILQKYHSLETIIAIIGPAELSAEDRQDYDKAKKLMAFFAQNLYMTAPLTGIPGEYISREDTLSGIEEILLVS